MKSLRASAARLALILMVAFSANASAGVNFWTGIGPEGADVKAVVMDPTNGLVAYVATNRGGTYKTIDGGLHWFSINQGLVLNLNDPLWTLSYLVIDPGHPSTLFAGIGGRLFQTTDGGGLWNALGSLPTGVTIGMVFDPGTPARLYAMTMNAVYRSEDLASTWIRIYQAPFLSAPVWALAVSPEDRKVLYVGGHSQAVSKSIDGGQTWTAVGPGEVKAIVVDPTHPNIVYAGSSSSGVYKSVDAGATWTPVNDGLAVVSSLRVRCLVIDPASPSTLYAGTDGGVYRTTDGGAHWAPVNSSLGAQAFTSGLAIDATNPSRLLAGFGGIGVFGTTTAGQDWSPRNTGIVASRVQQVATHPGSPGVLLAGLYQVGLGRTGNGGATWTVGSNGFPVPYFQSMALAPSNPSAVYVATGDALGGVFRSGDAGFNWFQSDPGFQNIRSIAVDPFLAGTVYCSSYFGAPPGNGAFRSTDGAQTWSPSGDGLFFPFSQLAPLVSSFLIDPVHPFVVYAIGSGLLYRSVDGGAHWGLMPAPGITGLVQVMAIDPKNPQVLYAGTDSDGIVKSANGGGSWSATTSSRVIHPVAIVVDPVDSTVVYAAESFNLVWKSVDSGRNWNAIGAGIPAIKPLTSLAIDAADRAVLYLGVDGGGVFTIRQIPPIVTGVSPASGAPGGGTTVTITGNNFGAGVLVRFGDVFSPTVTFVSPTTVTAVAPPGVDGTVDISVTNPDGQTGILHGGFEYREPIPPCVSSSTVLCLGSGRFRVTAGWQSQAASGQGLAVPLTTDTGYFWFFSSTNVEMIVKVLDGCPLNGKKWVFAGGLTNVSVLTTVTDTQTGSIRVYENILNSPFQPLQDTAAFSTCP